MSRYEGHMQRYDPATDKPVDIAQGGEMSLTLDEIKEQFPDWPFERMYGDFIISFAKGRFDYWLVDAPGNVWLNASDDLWLQRAKDAADRHGRNEIYLEFNELYHLITPDPYDLRAIYLIENRVYCSESAEMLKTFYWLRYAMLAEERRRVEDRKYPLGKRVKRLGLLQVLYHGMTPQEAASWSKGRPAKEIAAMCRKYGF